MFIGVEMRSNQRRRLSAREEAIRIINGMRVEGMLIGGTGREGNVLKIRPPLPSTQENAQLLLHSLRQVLSR